ncbi:MAG: thioredoxin domain-containing protein, partial [Methanobacteriota archaeon]
MLGMLELIPKVRDLWQNDRSKLLSIAGDVARSLRPMTEHPSADDLGEEILSDAALQLSALYDRHYGGFGYAPKFPVAHYMLFLMRYYGRSGSPDHLRMVEETLSAMRRGGIFDQLGGGFHRYSTDQEWRVPHFEKMLYDQAMLVLAYTEAYQLTGKDEYRTVAVECLEYMLRDLRDSSGGFYSAEDADSEGVEGKFYLWKHEEVQAVLAPLDARVARLSFGITDEGNVAGHPGMPAGANVLYEARTPAQVAARLGIAEDEANERLMRAKAELYAARERRVRPDTDDKCLTDWNGLAIAAFARAGAVFGSASYQEAARRAAGFLLEHMKQPDGGLLHRYRDGEAAIDGLLDD